MNLFSRVLSALISLSILLIGPANSSLAAPSLQASSPDWDALVAAARQEGTLTISAPRGFPELREAMTERFIAQYGITVNYEQAGPADVVRQMRQLGDGESPWDVFVGGTDTLMFNLKPLGVLQPLEPLLIRPDVKDGSNWVGGRLPFFDNDGLGIAFARQAAQYFWVNTERADPDAITTWQDLLDPQWKGQILLTSDPREPGHGRSVFGLFLDTLGPDFTRAMLTRQDLIIPRSDEEADALLLAGNYLMCICNNSQGAAIVANKLPFRKIDPHNVKEGITVTSSFANVAVPKRSAHPNAARLFLNWLLSSEAGERMSRATGVPSMRTDVPRDFVSPGTIPEPTWEVSNDENAAARGEEALRFVEAVLGPLDRVR